MIGRIILGLCITALGWLMVWKTQWFQSMLGYIAWAEEHLGAGGTRTFYKLLGMAIIVLGFIVVTNLFDAIVGNLLRSIF